jgi:hypothetical protein
MSKRRIPSPQRTTRAPAVTPAGERVRFIGLSLSGGKADKACLAVVDYFPKHHKVFLSKLVDRIKNEELVSADRKILDLIEEHSEGADCVAFDVPWELPVSLREDSGNQILEQSREPHILWMREYFNSLNKKKKPKRMFTPYTQRCVEMYVASSLEEPFLMNQALGANNAPLLARAAYLRRRIALPAIEVHPRLALWRIGRSLDMMKSHLRLHRHAARGIDSRRAILDELSDHNVAFLYVQDQRVMIESSHAFEAFLCAFTAFLKYRKQTEPRPSGFPEKEDWIEIPVQKIRWKEL